MNKIIGEINAMEVNVDVVNLVNACDHSLEQINKFSAAQNYIGSVSFLHISLMGGTSSNNKKWLIRA